MGKHEVRSGARRRALRGLGVLALAAGGMVALGTPSAVAAPTTLEFGGPYINAFQLPAGPVTVSFTVVGGAGGADASGLHRGGYGGYRTGTFTWTGPAVTVTVYSGGQGYDGSPAGSYGFNGGGGGGFTNPEYNGGLRGHGGNGGSGTIKNHYAIGGGGGGGGGATLVVINNVVVLVAGGGGGGSQLGDGGNGGGAGSLPLIRPGGVGKTGLGTQEGGGGGGGGSNNGVGGYSGRPGTGGSGGGGMLNHLKVSLTSTGSTGLDGFGQPPNLYGGATFTGEGISCPFYGCV